MNHATTNTHLEVICGPMFAGKTTELMSQLPRRTLPDCVYWR
jgi:hypothetical protein